MKKKEIYQERRLYTKRFGLFELTNQKHPLFKNNRKDFGDYQSVLLRSEGYNSNGQHKTERVARLIVRTFLELMLKDIILRNAVFHFPLPGTIKLRIATSPNPKQFSLETLRRVNLPWLSFGYNFLKRTMGFYHYMVFHKKYRDLLYIEGLRGHSYPVGRSREEFIPKIQNIEKIEEFYHKNGVSDIDQYIDAPEMYELN